MCISFNGIRSPLHQGLPLAFLGHFLGPPDVRGRLIAKPRCGIVPAKIAGSFTMAGLAVLTVMARQCQRTGICVLHIDAIAA
jgi:hypothetical protein